MRLTAIMQTWVNDPTRANRLWLGKHCAVAAWAGLLLAWFTPPHGSGFTVCWLKVSTGIPCLGCGITRSLSCGMRGMFAESLQYHPLGLLILILLSCIAVQSVLPKHWRDRLKSYLEARAAVFNLLYAIFVALFVIYGTGRALLRFAEL